MGRYFALLHGAQSVINISKYQFYTVVGRYIITWDVIDGISLPDAASPDPAAIISFPALDAWSAPGTAGVDGVVGVAPAADVNYNTFIVKFS